MDKETAAEEIVAAGDDPLIHMDKAVEYITAGDRLLHGALEDYWHAGQHLAIVRKTTPHGEWRTRLKSVGLSKSRAHRLIQLARFELSHLGTFRSMDAALNTLAPARSKRKKQADKPLEADRIGPEPDKAEGLVAPPVQTEDPAPGPDEAGDGSEAEGAAPEPLDDEVAPTNGPPQPPGQTDIHPLTREPGPGEVEEGPPVDLETDPVPQELRAAEDQVAHLRPLPERLRETEDQLRQTEAKLRETEANLQETRNKLGEAEQQNCDLQRRIDDLKQQLEASKKAPRLNFR